MPIRFTTRAFSLIEVVFALAIASFSLLLLLALLPTGMRTNQETLNESKALQVGNELLLDIQTDLSSSEDLFKPPFDGSGNVLVSKGDKVKAIYGYSTTKAKYLLSDTSTGLEEPRYFVELTYVRVPQEEDSDADGNPDTYSALPVEAVVSIYWPFSVLSKGNNNLNASSVTASDQTLAERLDLYFTFLRP